VSADEADQKRHDFFVNIAMTGVTELRRHLSVDEEHYKRLAVRAQPNAKDYFLYGVLDDVQGAGVAMMRWCELLGGEENHDDADVVSRIVAKSLAAERALWMRRLVEALAHLICFSTSDSEPYYRHWLLMSELRERLFQLRDYEDYYACSSRNLRRGADRIIDDIRALEADLDFGRCWYLRNASQLAADPRPGSLTATSASVLRFCLQNAEPRERMTLGLGPVPEMVNPGAAARSAGRAEVGAGVRRFRSRGEIVQGRRNGFAFGVFGRTCGLATTVVSVDFARRSGERVSRESQ